MLTGIFSSNINLITLLFLSYSFYDEVVHSLSRASFDESRARACRADLTSFLNAMLRTLTHSSWVLSSRDSNRWICWRAMLSLVDRLLQGFWPSRGLVSLRAPQLNKQDPWWHSSETSCGSAIKALWLADISLFLADYLFHGLTLLPSPKAHCTVPIWVVGKAGTGASAGVRQKYSRAFGN